MLQFADDLKQPLTAANRSATLSLAQFIFLTCVFIVCYLSLVYWKEDGPQINVNFEITTLFLVKHEKTNLGPFHGCRLPGTLKDIAASVQSYWSFATHISRKCLFTLTILSVDQEMQSSPFMHWLLPLTCNVHLWCVHCKFALMQK